MLLTLRSQSSYGADARATADSVITALTPAAWYRNATGVTSAGGFASQWDDYSGNTRHLVQAVGTNQPAYAAGVFTFDGADNYLKTATFTLNQAFTFYLVIEQTSWTSGEGIVDGNTLFSTSIIQNPTTPTFKIYAGSNACDNSGLAVGTYGIIACVFNGASSSTRVNNNAAATGNCGAAAIGAITLGALGNSTAFSAIKVKEVCLFPAAHNTTTQDSVITALNNALTVF